MAEASALEKQYRAANANPPPPSRPASPSKTLDIGAYDGGFEDDDQRRGSIISGEAAELLKLDSSTSVYVCHFSCN